MTHEEKNRVPNLDTAIEAMRNDVPPETEVAAAGARVWARMQTAETLPQLDQIRGCEDFRKLLPAYDAGKLGPSRTLLLEDHLRGCVACHEIHRSGEEKQVIWEFPKPSSRWGIPRFAMAAAALVVLTVGSLWVSRILETPSGPRAHVQSIQGSLYKVTSAGDQPLAAGAEVSQGEFIRTAGNSHAFVQLQDGSIVEMSERSEFSVSARRKDTTVHLDQGRIIVQAAKRKAGHLYVLTPDARVGVTGTVFAVNSGMKGSRVSVIEGEVHVDYAGKEDVLHPGDQTVTSSNLTTIPVKDEIAWSDNLQQHLELLAQFAILQKKFEQIQTPGLRYSSNILGRLPANTVVYASIPNLGEAMKEASDIFQNQLQQSAVLREWWNKGHKQGSDGLTFEQMIAKLHGLSQYIGDEVVLAGFGGNSGGGDNVVIIAELRNAGVRGYLEREFSNLGTARDGKSNGIHVYDEQQLAGLTQGSRHDLIAVAGEQFLLFSPSVNTLRLVDTQLKNSAGGLTGTDFGQRIEQAYQRGAGMLISVNMHEIIAEARARHAMEHPQASPERADVTGFQDAQYLFVEHRDQPGAPDNRAVLAFSGPRHGMASWLAAPSAVGSLDFVSSNASAAFSFLTKSPAAMLDDVLSMSQRPGSKNGLAEANAELQLDIRNDIAGTLGGDVTVALDGPVLPKPSWKVVLQVYDASRLQSSIARLIQVANDKAAKHNHPGVELKQEEAGGQIFYTIRSLDPKALGTEVNYTYSGGYMVAAPSRALVMAALNTAANKDSLARSAEFQSLLPKDGHMNFSALLYQNVGPLLKPLADQLSGQQMQALTQLANDSKPSVICAYAGDNQIELASASKLLPFDLNSVGIATLLGRDKRGTSKASQP